MREELQDSTIYAFTNFQIACVTGVKFLPHSTLLAVVDLWENQRGGQQCIFDLF